MKSPGSVIDLITYFINYQLSILITITTTTYSKGATAFIVIRFANGKRQ